MAINLNPFTWWNGATIGTWFGLRGKTRVGEDGLGNVYYQGGKDTAGNPRRWVIYDGANDASRVAPEWLAWLQHTIDDVPDRALPPVRQWQKPALANMTGTPHAYRPSGALEKGGNRVSATGDYEAWSPDA
ncbi:NADH:ubiquinone oxidoreductase subunit NDUFA12 [Sphingomonas sp. NBWT7]|uniref:NADH:ubiquinone oxidoreductase subunit NDUFA12 n=1 Tax=Sphingomonas sp. NBWT7 TaxID=2596913 RepID=UPI00162A31D7|nr:NADH:ubiquinone oxidoreductase subunit NDUFA12 [Sphingomonas sp. NBWT7]QNE33064.1 NADH:ubiquinone oxidoreductase subunit NDUFA12 [Sphingomonas sp. NBWT7]